MRQEVGDIDGCIESGGQEFAKSDGLTQIETKVGLVAERRIGIHRSDQPRRLPVIRGSHPGPAANDVALQCQRRRVRRLRRKVTGRVCERYCSPILNSKCGASAVLHCHPHARSQWLCNGYVEALSLESAAQKTEVAGRRIFDHSSSVRLALLLQVSRGECTPSRYRHAVERVAVIGNLGHSWSKLSSRRKLLVHAMLCLDAPLVHRRNRQRLLYGI